MATADVEPAPALPDYLTNPNAVLGDTAEWRYGRAPDYSNTRTVFENTKKHNHEATSLPSLVQNLVKNWEIEASFKSKLEDWRTVDHPNYTFAINGGPPQTAEHMLKVGTYNAIIAPNEFYSPKTSDFSKSHKTFKRMMPTFAWEVIEVYSGPPQVAFRWRHWGEMKNDYVGFNDKGEKITAKAHGGQIDIEGVTVATVDDKVRLQKVETWFDPLEMFRQIAPNGIVNKEIVPLETTTAPEKTIAPENIITPEKSLGLEEISKSTSEKTVAPGEAVAPGKEVAPEKTVPNKTAPPEEDVASETTANPQETTAPQVTTAPEKANAPDEVAAPGMTAAPEETVASEAAVVPKDTTTFRKTDAPEETAAPEKSVGLESLNLGDSFTTTETAKVEAPLDSTVNRGVDDLKPEVEISAPEAGEAPGNAVAAARNSVEARLTHEEMSRVTAAECPFLMNRE